MAEVLIACADRNTLARAILEQPDAADRVSAMLAATARVNEAIVLFMERPTETAAEELAFAQALLVEVVARLHGNEPDPLPMVVTQRLRDCTARGMPLVLRVHRACMFALAVWNAAGGEIPASHVIRADRVSASDVTPSGGSKPH